MATIDLAEIRTLLRLAWPVALTSLNWTLLQVVDVMVVGSTGTHETAGFGASRIVTFVAVMVAIGMLSGILVKASRADGAGDLAATGGALREAWLLGAFLGLVGLIVLMLSAGPMLALLQVPGDVAAIATRVITILACGFPAQMIAIATSNWLEGVSRPRRILVVNLVTLPVNAALAWTLAEGHFGLPRMGAEGAAMATAIVVWGGAVGMIAAAVTLPDARARDIRLPRLGELGALVRATRSLLSFGLIPGLSSGLELVGFSWLITLSTRMGDVTAHAFQIVFSVHNLTFGFALGLGSAAGVRAGNAVGEGRPEAARLRVALAGLLALVIMGMAAAALMIAPALVVGAFPAAAEVRTLAVGMLFIWAPFILFDGLQVVFMFALRSLGDQIAAGVNGILAFFVVTGGAGALLTRAGWGPWGLVVASGLGMTTAAVLNGGRLAWFTSPRRLQSSG